MKNPDFDDWAEWGLMEDWAQGNYNIENAIIDASGEQFKRLNKIANYLVDRQQREWR